MSRLSDFTAQLKTRNVSRPAQYLVEITTPPMFNPQNEKVLVSMWCAAIQTPQTTIFTRDEYIEDGTRRKYAFDQDYQNLTLTFYLDQEYKIKQFFDEWKNRIVPNRRNFEYPNSYTADKLNLSILNQDDRVTYVYEYSRIFPKSINAVDLSYANGNQVATLTVDFVYEEVYYSEIADTGAVSSTSKPVLNTTVAPPKPINAEAAEEISFDENQGGFSSAL